jgi:Marseilleviridae restriction endonuclease
MCYTDNNTLCKDNNCQECHNASFASVENSRYWYHKNKITPREITKGSPRKFLFVCKNGHEFEGVIKRITYGGLCPYPCCNKSPKLLCNDNNCKSCFEASFASSDKVNLWSDRNDKRPREVFKGSRNEYLIKCPKTNHEYLMKLNNMKYQNCPFPCCCKSPSKLCDNNNCQICFNASFASYFKSKYFSDKNKDKNRNIINPRNIFKKSHKKYIFKCNKSNHEFESQLDNMVHHNSWCPYPCCCDLGSKLCNDENCKICFEASFASHPKSKYFSRKNNINPRFLMKHSNEKYLFECDRKHEFEAALNHISNDSWCSTCPFQNESYCISVIEGIVGKKFKKCRPFKSHKLELDGYNEELKLAIEYNGEQHYKYVSLFHKNKENALEKQRERDKIKENLCEENGIYLIIVPYFEKNKEQFIKDEYKKYLNKNKKKSNKVAKVQKKI